MPHIIPVYATGTSTLVEIRPPSDTFVVSQNMRWLWKSVFCLACCESVQLEQNWSAHPRRLWKTANLFMQVFFELPGPCPAGLPGLELCKLAKWNLQSFYWSCCAVESWVLIPCQKAAKWAGEEAKHCWGRTGSSYSIPAALSTVLYHHTPPARTNQVRALITTPGSATSEQQQH